MARLPPWSLMPAWVPGLRTFVLLPAICCACLAVPHRSFAQEVTISAQVAPFGSSIDAALHRSLNLPTRAAAGLQGEQVAAWAQIDRDRLSALLRALGFYDANVHVAVDRRAASPPDTAASRSGERSADAGALRITFEPTAGPRYRIRSVRLVDARTGDTRDLAAEEGEMLARLSGAPASADVLAGFEAEWLERERQAGHVFAAVARRTVALDPGTHSVDATIAVIEGPQARFGPVQFSGLQRVNPQSLDQYVPFKVGDPYAPAQLDRLRANLRSLPFFQSVRVEPANALDASGLLPLQATVVEKPPDAQQLMLSGSIGIVVLALAAAMVAVAELATAAAGPALRRYRPTITAAIWILVATSALLALQRLLYLGDV